MKLSDVPQDNVEHFHGQSKALYALDGEGNYTTAPSNGWEPEAVALNQALDELKERSGEAKARALRGECGPLEYYMYAKRMDLPTLAQSTGLFQWRVRRHFQAKNYKKLSRKMLQRYADALDLPVEELITWQQGTPDV